MTSRQRRGAPDVPAPAGSALAINLRHLRALSAVAAAGSVAGAAEQLFRVPSAVTRSIAELERGLGVALFERRARGMLLTVDGERVLVLARAHRIEREFEEARALLARGGAGSSAAVRSTFGSFLNGHRLAVFASLADKRHMGAVAREFGITQPGISSGLKDLEAGLATVLFERSARGLVPTPAGEILAFHFKRALAELRHIGPDLAASRGILQGTVQVGALPLGRTHILPLAIASLVSRHPQLRVVTAESPFDALAAALRSGDIDFILGALRPPTEASGLQQDAVRRSALDHRSLRPSAGAPQAPRPGCVASRRLGAATARHAGARAVAGRVRRGGVGPAAADGRDRRPRSVARSAADERHVDRDLGAPAAPRDPRRRPGRARRRARRDAAQDRLVDPGRRAVPSPGARALMDEIHAVVAGAIEFRTQRSDDNS
jgi:LysR family transcriptional regulator, regulator for genes of the gallate degradation pathway